MLFATPSFVKAFEIAFNPDCVSQQPESSITIYNWTHKEYDIHTKLMYYIKLFKFSKS